MPPDKSPQDYDHEFLSGCQIQDPGDVRAAKLNVRTSRSPAHWLAEDGKPVIYPVRTGYHGAYYPQGGYVDARGSIPEADWRSASRIDAHDSIDLDLAERTFIDGSVRVLKCFKNYGYSLHYVTGLIQRLGVKLIAEWDI